MRMRRRTGFFASGVEAAVCLANEMVGGADRLREGASERRRFAAGSTERPGRHTVELKTGEFARGVHRF